MSFLRTDQTATTDKDQDMQLGGFLKGMGMDIESSVTQKDASGYWKYHGKIRGFDVLCRVASKIMTVGHRVVWVEMLWSGRIFYVTALDTMNIYPPTPVHIENMEVGLARVVYNK
jgi:hypothetical protein